MKKLVALYITLVLAVFAGLHIQKDPGYALFALGQWSVEMPLWFFAVALVTALFLMHYSINIISHIASLKFRIKTALRNRKFKTAHCRTRQGLVAFSEGNWLEAEKLLLKGLPASDSPLINYLTAARAAQEQGKNKQRDKYLREAERSMPDTKIAVLLTQAELQLQAKQYEQAHATLSHLITLVPKHPHVLKLMLSLYKEINRWHEIQTLIPKLVRLKLISKQEMQALERNIYFDKINQALQEKDNNGPLLQIWNQIPKNLQRDPEFIKFYATQLQEKQEWDHVESILRQFLRKQWDEALIEMYGQLKDIDHNKQFKFAESFTRSKNSSAMLFLTLGRLAKQLQLWGKCKDYLEHSIAIEPIAETYFELGELYRLLSDEQNAADRFEKGLSLALNNPPQAPKDSKELVNYV